MLAAAATAGTLVFSLACGSAGTALPTQTQPTPTPESTNAATPQALPSQTSTAAVLPELSLQKVFANQEFSRLTNLAQAGERFFVTEQSGRIISLAADSGASVFLDIRHQVNDAGNEEGLLGLAFGPDYPANGRFYVYYSAGQPRRSVVSRFTAGNPDEGAADPESELVILEVPQPFSNHNGGQLAFGPEGMLYISLGDGGSGGDPRGNGQNISTLLGSILRIDVSGIGPDRGYDVPPDNPFVGVRNAREEIWAYGLRNPWRFSFDRQNGALWAGDVGQNSFEEIDLVQKGGNYGWNTLEGGHCFSPRTGCDSTGTELPVIEYGSNRGCSVIGGYVYRGDGIPALSGTYLYGDYCSGELRGFRFEDGRVERDSLLVNSGLRITSFGQDEAGEIYILTQDGEIHRLTADR